MSRWRWRVGRGIAALALAGAQPAWAQAADPVLEETAEALRQRIGEEHDGVALAAVRAEGRMLVVTLRLAPDLEDALAPARLGAIFALGLCEEGGTSFFEPGRSLRVDLAVHGRTEIGPVIDRCPSPAEARLTAADFVRGMQPQLGREVGMGLRLAGAHADGNVLVITIDGATGWRSGAEAGPLAAGFVRGFCEDGGAELTAELFASGFRIRVETTEAGRDPRIAAQIERCPAP
jgi:hypothetical protein